MNEETTQHRSNPEILDLGTQFPIYLSVLGTFAEYYTIQQFLAALEATTTLTELSINFGGYTPTPENNRRFIKPLCRCIANLRRQNEHHPLRTLQLLGCKENGILDMCEQLMIAAKQCGIRQLSLSWMDNVPIHLLLDVCRDNSNLKALDLFGMSFTNSDTAVSFPRNDWPQDPSATRALGRLFLGKVWLNNSAAATEFHDFVANLYVSALILGNVTARSDDEDDDDDDDDDNALTKRIVSEFKMPSVEQLSLRSDCGLNHFQAALEASTTSVIELHVTIGTDAMARLESLTSMIRRAAGLKCLAINCNSHPGIISPPPQFFHAMEACSTITEINVNPNDRRDFSQRVVQHLHRITARNEQLALFVASPSTYPTDKLLTLMRQFVNSPTGRYVLTRRLPEIFLFEQGDSDTELAVETAAQEEEHFL